MEKIVLSKGYEFELVSNGVAVSSDHLDITFLPGENTVEELLKIWQGNSTLTVKVNDTSVRVFNNFTSCANVALTPNYLIDTKFECPECGAEVGPTATTCPTCNATFEAPKVVETRATVCTVRVKIPDINDRMADAENAIEDIINSILNK